MLTEKYLRLSCVDMCVVYATSNRVSPRFEITNRSLTTIEDRWWPRWHRRPRCGQTWPSLWSDPQCSLGWTLGLISYNHCNATRHHWRVHPLQRRFIKLFWSLCWHFVINNDKANHIREVSPSVDLVDGAFMSRSTTDCRIRCSIFQVTWKFLIEISSGRTWHAIIQYHSTTPKRKYYLLRDFKPFWSLNVSSSNDEERVSNKHTIYWSVLIYRRII